MKMLGLFSGDDGQSHFREFDLPEVPPPTPPAHSTPRPSAGWTLGESKPGHFIDWHVARVPRILIVLSGAIEVGVGSGEVRRFGPGDALYAQDTTGQGHTSHFVGDTPTRMITIPMAP
jgi:quercetin dioxygenase-like cupin family protein